MYCVRTVPLKSIVKICGSYCNYFINTSRLNILFFNELYVYCRYSQSLECNKRKTYILRSMNFTCKTLISF